MHYAQRESSKYNRNYCIVTFDQQLFIKAVDIIAANPDLSNVIPRLGRFLLLMYFMAMTGFIMAGRVFERLWLRVTHMFDGHAYSRVLLLQTLTAQVIVTFPFETTGSRDSIDEPALNQIWSEKTTEEKVVSDAILKPEVQLTNVLNQLYRITICQSRTAKLWIQYAAQVSLMQQFVRVERSGNFDLHLHVIAL